MLTFRRWDRLLAFAENKTPKRSDRTNSTLVPQKLLVKQIFITFFLAVYIHPETKGKVGHRFMFLNPPPIMHPIMNVTLYYLHIKRKEETKQLQVYQGMQVVKTQRNQHSILVPFYRWLFPNGVLMPSKRDREFTHW